jgi:hypothetical protein
MMDEMLRAV